MIAPLKTSSVVRSTESVHEKFLKLLPGIQQQAAFAFRSISAEARGELTEEVIANAYLRVHPARAPRQIDLGIFDPFGTVCHPSGPCRAARRRPAERA